MNTTPHMSAQKYRESQLGEMPVNFLEKPVTKLKAPRSHEEDDITKEVSAYLQDLYDLKKILVFSHLPLEEPGAKIQTIMKRKAMGVRPGVPDFLIVALDGRCLFLELKTDTGVVSPVQKEWLFALETYTQLHGQDAIHARTAIGSRNATKIIEDFI